MSLGQVPERRRAAELGDVADQLLTQHWWRPFYVPRLPPASTALMRGCAAGPRTSGYGAVARELMQWRVWSGWYVNIALYTLAPGGASAGPRRSR